MDVNEEMERSKKETKAGICRDESSVNDAS